MNSDVTRSVSVRSFQVEMWLAGKKKSYGRGRTQVGDVVEQWDIFILSQGSTAVAAAMSISWQLPGLSARCRRMECILNAEKKRGWMMYRTRIQECLVFGARIGRASDRD